MSMRWGDRIDNMGVLAIPEFPFSNDFLPVTGGLLLSHVYGRMDVCMSCAQERMTAYTSHV